MSLPMLMVRRPPDAIEAVVRRLLNPAAVG